MRFESIRGAFPHGSDKGAFGDNPHFSTSDLEAKGLLYLLSEPPKRPCIAASRSDYHEIGSSRNGADNPSSGRFNHLASGGLSSFQLKIPAENNLLPFKAIHRDVGNWMGNQVGQARQ